MPSCVQILLLAYDIQNFADVRITGDPDDNALIMYIWSVAKDLEMGRGALSGS